MAETEGHTAVVAVRRAAGSLFGLAYGDALGKPVEFRTYDQIVAVFGPGGPAQLPDPALVTDDTQMALAVGFALRDHTDAAPDTIAQTLIERFIAWLHSPDNNRAPGNTCLAACAALDRGVPWRQATVMGSKGCGANMRVTPVGLIPGLDIDTMAGIAQLQAALTHGHPTALAAAELTALTVRLLRDGTPLAEIPPLLLDRCRTQRGVYQHDWLGDLWAQSHQSSATEYIHRGWTECQQAITTLSDALSTPDDGGDVCRLTGDGWIAEQALATALHAALRHPTDPVAALGRAAATHGDSDSIACLAGAFHGAAAGITAWPAPWITAIENSDQLAELANTWDAEPQP